MTQAFVLKKVATLLLFAVAVSLLSMLGVGLKRDPLTGKLSLGSSFASADAVPTYSDPVGGSGESGCECGSGGSGGGSSSGSGGGSGGGSSGCGGEGGGEGGGC